MQLIRARLGEDFYPSVTEAIKLGGKRVLIDTDLADGGFRRDLSAGKPVDIDLSPVWTSSRPGQSLQLALQFVGIVGKRIEIFTFEHNRICILIRTRIDRRRIGLDLHLLLLHLDLHRDIHRLRLPGREGDR